ncbi:MAG: transglutaminase family protein, partial [Hyphomicrobiales bacterium]|nr:transglutaminase family protein [Hyphomicrobiales bacterium]
QQDPHGNWQARCVFPDKADHLRIEVDLVAEMATYNPFDFFIEPYAEAFPFVYEANLAAELAPYLELEPCGPALESYVAGVPRAEKQLTNFLVDLNLQLHKDIRYVIRMEPGVQAPDETLALRSGSCRDSAWLLVQILR